MGGKKRKSDGSNAQGDPTARMKRKPYEAELRRLHGELVAMQEWVKATGAKICIVFEGRDSAGKGGTIKAITERVSPRVFRIVALPTPTEREKSQTRRLLSRIDDPRKIWKLSAMDLKSYSRWHDYARARDDMFAATNTGWAPWHLVRTDDKRRGRLNLITHLLSQVPYESLEHTEIKLPKRQSPRGYAEPDLSVHSIATPF